MTVTTAELEPIADLNTTPLIDVMLVLLIMFIITIPIQTHAVRVDLPSGTDAQPVLNQNRIAITDAGAVLWNGSPVDMATLRATLDAVAADPRSPVVEMQPAAEARYERVDEVIAVARRANVSMLGFVGNEHYAAAF